MTALVLLLLILIFLTVCVGFYGLLKQQGRILLRLDELDKLAKSAAEKREQTGEAIDPDELVIGTEFSAFTLPDISGKTIALEDFRGKRTLLVLWSFQCGFCEMIAPDLAGLQAGLEDANVALVLLAYGELAANHKGAAEHGLDCPILVMKNGEIPKPFNHRGTPSAYLLDEEGRVDSPFVSGADKVLALARAIVEQHAENPEVSQLQSNGSGNGGEVSVPEPAHRVRLPGLRGEVGLGDAIKGLTSAVGIKPCPGCERRAAVLNRWLSFSGSNGDGLKAGTSAPLFQLPDLEGRLISLEHYRGRCVLLVFSDPKCGPCDELAPHLVRVHEKHAGNGLSVILVVGGDPDENRRKAEQHGFRFPVVIQSKYKLSKEYRTFATPVAFLITEDGVLAQDVAVGVEPILTLVREKIEGGME